MCEKANLSMCRHALIVLKKAQSTAVRGELGLYPLGIDVATNILGYKDYIKNSNNSLLQKALQTNKNIAELNMGNMKLWINHCNAMSKYPRNNKQ